MLVQGSRAVIWKNDSLKNKSFWFDDFESICDFSSQKEENVKLYDVKTQVSGLGNSEE